MSRYSWRVDLLGPSVDGLEPRWQHGRTTTGAEAQYLLGLALRTGRSVRLVRLEATEQSPIETVIQVHK